MDTNLESQNPIPKRKYSTLKSEQHLALQLANSELLSVKSEDKQTVIDLLFALAKTIERLRKKKRILKEAIENHKAIKGLEKDLQADVAKLAAWNNSKCSDARHALSLNLNKQNQTLYFRHQVEYFIEIYENRKQKLESKLLKFNIKLDRADKY